METVDTRKTPAPKMPATPRKDIANEAMNGAVNGAVNGVAHPESSSLVASRLGRVELLDLAFDPMTMQAATERCLQWCEGPRESRVVITANAAILCMMQRDPALAAACREGDLILADGMSVVWGLRAAGHQVPERVTGVDLMTSLLEQGAAKGLRVYLLGARKEVVSKLARLCEERYPGIVIAGYRDGYFSSDEEEAIAEEIREARPDILLVGMQSPFKEGWCRRHRRRLEVPVIMGVGGAFDVHAGYIRRAPKFVQAIGMEWAWRLLMEPRKLWKRYLTTNSVFLWRAGREVLGKRLRPKLA